MPDMNDFHAFKSTSGGNGSGGGGFGCFGGNPVDAGIANIRKFHDPHSGGWRHCFVD